MSLFCEYDDYYENYCLLQRLFRAVHYDHRDNLYDWLYAHANIEKEEVDWMIEEFVKDESWTPST